MIGTLDRNKTIFIANKSDKAEDVSRETNWNYISVKTGEGIEDLKERMSRAVTGGSVEGSGNAVMLNERQENLLRQTIQRLDDARRALDDGLSAEFYSVDLTEAGETLRQITGESLGEDVLDTIFERFCIGK